MEKKKLQNQRKLNVPLRFFFPLRLEDTVTTTFSCALFQKNIGGGEGTLKNKSGQLDQYQFGLTCQGYKMQKLMKGFTRESFQDCNTASPTCLFPPALFLCFPLTQLCQCNPVKLQSKLAPQQTQNLSKTISLGFCLYFSSKCIQVYLPFLVHQCSYIYRKKQTQDNTLPLPNNNNIIIIY